MFCYSRLHLSLSNLCYRSFSFRHLYLSNSAKGRVKQRPHVHTEVPVEPVGRVSLGRVARCGLFTFITINGLSFGSVVWSYEHWRSQTLRAKLGRPNETEGILHRVRKKFESIIGRPLRGDDLFWGIVAFNVLVFLGHHSPFSQLFRTYFVNSPLGPTPALSMLLSVFSHYSLMHLGVNMYVLHSFTPSLMGIIGPGEFLSLFLGGGIFASFMSFLGKAARRSAIPSVGASGGICAVLGAFCLLQPHARLCVPFVVDLFPHSFEAKSAAWTLLFVEFFATLVLSARSPIDHAAHLGGLLFGMYYGLAGLDGVWRRRNAIVAKWTEWRGR